MISRMVRVGNCVRTPDGRVSRVREFSGESTVCICGDQRDARQFFAGRSRPHDTGGPTSAWTRSSANSSGRKRATSTRRPIASWTTRAQSTSISCHLATSPRMRRHPQRPGKVRLIACQASPKNDIAMSLTERSGQGWAGKSLENVDKPLNFRCDPRKLCEEWNS